MSDNTTTKRTASADAALTVLAGVMADREMLYRAIEAGIEPHDFDRENDRIIWKAVQDLVSHGDKVEIGTVTATTQGQIDDMAADLLKRAAARWPGSSLVFDKAAHSLLLESRKRALAAAFSGGLKELADAKTPEDIDKVAMQAHERLACAPGLKRSRAHGAQEVAQKLRERITTPNRRIKTDIQKLDHVLGGGLDRGRMISVSGKYKVGKTTFLSTLGYNAAYRPNGGQPENVLFVTLERDKTDVEMLNAARHLGINQRELERHFTKHEKHFDDYARDPALERIRYMHQPGATIDEIVRTIVSETRSRGIGLALIDYYQVIAAQPKQQFNQHLMQVDQILSRLANSLGIAIVMAAQADADGLPRDSKTLLHSAAANFSLRRNPDSPEAWFDNLASNYIEQMDAGSPSNPAMVLDSSRGPFFKSC